MDSVSQKALAEYLEQTGFVQFYKAIELRKLLTKRPAHEQPDRVLFYLSHFLNIRSRQKSILNDLKEGGEIKIRYVGEHKRILYITVLKTASDTAT